MSSKRSSAKVFVTRGSPRTSSSSLSSQSSSSHSSTSSEYTYTSYDYNYESSATNNMGRSDYEASSSRPRQSFLRVPDPARKTYSPDICPPHANLLPVIAHKDGITKTSRGNVDVINQEKRHEELYEPRASDAKSADYRESSSNRKYKK